MGRSERQTEIFKGQVGYGTEFSGLATINSGDAFVTVSNANVTSGKFIGLTPLASSSPSLIGSGQPALGVNSVVNGISFMAVTVGGISTTGPISVLWYVTK